jgi:methyl-accepting chemotaxis protein
MQMDEMTQQNAALVEQSAAASEALGEQATNLTRLIAFFKVDGQTTASAVKTVTRVTETPRLEHSAPKRALKGAQAKRSKVESKPVFKKVAVAGGADEAWEEF